MDREEEERDQGWLEERKRGGSKVDGRKGNEGSGRLEEKAEGGHQSRTHGLLSILLADCSERIKDVSAQGEEKIKHVWMKAGTMSGVGKSKMNELRRDGAGTKWPKRKRRQLRRGRASRRPGFL